MIKNHLFHSRQNTPALVRCSPVYHVTNSLYLYEAAYSIFIGENKFKFDLSLNDYYAIEKWHLKCLTPLHSIRDSFAAQALPYDYFNKGHLTK